MGPRAIKRKQDKERTSQSRALFDFVVEYVVAIENKSRKERKRIFNSIELRWKMYVRKENCRVNMPIKLSLDGFRNVVKKRKAINELKEKLWKPRPSLFRRLFSFNKKTAQA